MFDHASIVGQQVYWEHGDNPESPYFVDAFVGEMADEGPLYRVSRDGQETLIRGELLSVMTHEGLVSLDNRTEGDFAREADALDSPAIPHPFEQVGKAGAAPVASVRSGGETAVPAFSTGEWNEYQDFLRWRMLRNAPDPGDMQTVRPLSPEESKVADAGAIEATPDPKGLTASTDSPGESAAQSSDFARHFGAVDPAQDDTGDPLDTGRGPVTQ